MTVRFVLLCTELPETLLHTVERYVTLRVLWFRRHYLRRNDAAPTRGACCIILVLLVVMSTDSETLRNCSSDTAHSEVLEVTVDFSVVFVFILLET